MKHILLFSSMFSIFMVNAQDDIKSKNIEVNLEIDTPESFTSSQWEEIINKISKHTIDFEPIGKNKQPKTAGKSNQVISTHIIGGLIAKQGQFPWQVQIILEGTKFCGGSLISKMWILTAAHCVHNISNFQIILGSTLRNVNETGRVVVSTTTKVVHTAYNISTYANDVGLIKLTTETKLNTYIAVLRLPSILQATRSFAKMNATISGWGRILNSSVIATNLSYVILPVMTNQECIKILGSKFIISSTLCTSGTGNKGICKGDSGGPLIIKEADGLYTQIGIVSFGSSSCDKSYPSAYARVTSFLGWISKNSKIAIRLK